MSEIGTITIKLEGASYSEIERYRTIIHTLLSSGVMNMRNGTAILSFDNDATLKEIELHIKRWKKDKLDLPLPQDKRPSRIEVIKSIS